MRSIIHERKCTSPATRGILPLLLFLLLSPSPAAAQSSNTGPTDPYYNRFSPTMAIIIIVLIAALFLVGFFSIYVRQCRQSPNITLRPLAARSRRHPRGLDPQLIQSFPTLDYSAVKIHKIGKAALECAVCLNEFEDSETLRLIPKCDHVFHPDCIDQWLASHTTCPVCRANLQPDSPHAADLEPQNDAAQLPPNADVHRQPDQPDVVCLNQTRASRWTRFPRSHSTGHSLLQPGQNTDRFTLRLPSDVRNQILNHKFHRSTSLLILPRESSSRRGYRTGGEGSNRGRSSRRLDRWVFTMAPPFLVRASSVRSPRVANTRAAGEETSADPIMPASAVDSARPPV